MKPLIAAALLLASVAIANTASAQAAAGSLPNTFDRPASVVAAPIQAAATPAGPATPAAPGLSMTPANPQAEATLRTLISGARGGAMDYDLMSDDLAAKMREQQGAITPLLVGFGDLQVVDFMGSQNGADLFAVTFANQATEWVIGFNEGGKVAALLFRPAQ